jgi:hypothetical protein
LIVLLRFLKHTVADCEQIKLITHKTTKRIFGRTHDRLAAHIEASVDQHRASSHLFEAFKQPVERLSELFWNSFSFSQSGIAIWKERKPRGASARYVSISRSNFRNGLS